ncbi:MAG: hypothetical protein JW874_12300 [Spirochaetales bacterium]|nr:hypothetical protein [Spirochaetales bacterium]
MRIDRKALVRRHCIIRREHNPWSPLSVGNGEFAFTADFTGFQTFLPEKPGTTPLCTMAQWGFHSYPGYESSAKYRQNLHPKMYKAGKRTVGYMTEKSGQEVLYHKLRINPHRLNLARISLVFIDKNGKDLVLSPADTRFSDICQTLEVWPGRLVSRFSFEGNPIEVVTVCHPVRDSVAFRISSEQPGCGQLAVRVSFPYGSHLPSASDWSREDKHESLARGKKDSKTLLIHRKMDNCSYYTTIKIGKNINASAGRENKHAFRISCSGNCLEVSVAFSPVEISEVVPSFRDTESAAKKHWEEFWSTGGAIDFSASTDPRAEELERRVILSRYLTAIQCSGSMPPQETGLTYNSWYGKFHLEMHFWHAAHFTLWNKPDMLLRSIGWYCAILENGVALARSQTYRGARWPKMTDPAGYDSPSPIGPLLCWQQPHLIMYLELLRRAGVPMTKLELFMDCLTRTTEFMADYPGLDRQGYYRILGPPLIPAQENHKSENSLNPCFELEYWRWGLETSAGLHSLLGREIPPEWEETQKRLSPCPTDKSNTFYLAHQNCPDTFERFNRDHPSMLCALGMLPGKTISPVAMSNTLDKVISSWDFESCWGWDFPVMAMTAARLGRTQDAVDLLLMNTGKNTYLQNGHNSQLPEKELSVYLPGNGGLLLAVAMMTAGWYGCTKRLPGFPDNGKWSVRCEDINKYI